MNDLVSVIVPIYKVEKYLSRCVDSIINQTYNNLEIILVDDGSPDNCPSICDEYAKQDNRIKVVHKTNGGLSDARNAGMTISTGQYISFIDSDDWIDLDMIEVLIDKAAETNADIVSCGVRMIWDDGTPSKLLTKCCGDIIFRSTESALSGFIKADQLIQTVWNKIYKRSVVEKIPFPKNKINEDEFWSWKVIANSKIVVSLERPMYNYLQRGGSIMQSSSNYDPMNIINAKIERNIYIKDNHPTLYDQCQLDLLYTCLFHAQRSKILLQKKKYKRSFKIIKKVAKNSNPSKSYLKNFPMIKKLRIYSINKCFGLVCIIQNMFNIGNESNI